MHAAQQGAVSIMRHDSSKVQTLLRVVLQASEQSRGLQLAKRVRGALARPLGQQHLAT